MKNIKNICLAALAVFALASCDDVLNIPDNSAISTEIWNNETSANLYVNSLLAKMMPSFNTGASYSDETYNTNDMLTGDLEAGTAYSYMVDGANCQLSDVTYKNIRGINIALEAMKSSTMLAETQKKILGQLYFLRAWQYWRIVLTHGGIPYITDVQNPYGDSTVTYTARNKTSECIEYLKADLNAAIADLPAKWSTEYARPCRAAAAALLGRIMLFYASPQFNPDNLKARWDSAYAYNKKAKDIADADGFALLDCSTGSSLNNDDYKSFTGTSYGFNGIFLDKQNSEVIWARPYYNNVYMHSYENSTRPCDQTADRTTAPSNAPTWALVKAFPDKNGVDISVSDLYDSTYYYKDRDPRFYSDIVFNGELYTFPGYADRIQWTYKNKSGKLGMDNEAVVSETGFYCRKMIDQSLDKSNTYKGYTDWVEIRYAEVLLNLAECAAETGNEDEAYTLLGSIRARAGIPEGTQYYGLKAGSFSLIERIMNERRIELCFENKRFWDLRRRNMFADDLGANIKKLNGWKLNSSRLTFTAPNVSNNKQITTLYTSKGIDYIYKTFLVASEPTLGPLVKALNFPQPTKAEVLAGSRSYNFFDISTDYINRSPALQQTLGWENGKFNPFE
jgi:hypothetical protein